MRFRGLCRDNRDVFEHSGAARDRHQDHHAGEQADRVPVDALDGFRLVENSDQDHHRSADQRDDRAIDLLRHDDRVGDGQDDRRDPHRIEAEIDVGRRVHRGPLPWEKVRDGPPQPSFAARSGTHAQVSSWTDQRRHRQPGEQQEQRH